MGRGATTNKTRSRYTGVALTSFQPKKNIFWGQITWNLVSGGVSGRYIGVKTTLGSIKSVKTNRCDASAT